MRVAEAQRSPRGAERGGATGFTLVEVLVAVALLAFLVLGVMALLTTVVHQNKLAQQRSVATALASERISKLMAQPFRTAAAYAAYRLPDETASAGPPSTLTSDYGSIPGFPTFKRVVMLSYDVPVPGMLRVEAKVYWKDRQQGEKTHEMVTYLHPGLEQGK